MISAMTPCEIEEKLDLTRIRDRSYHLLQPLATDCTRAFHGSQVTVNYENRNGDFCLLTTDSNVAYHITFLTKLLCTIFLYTL